VKTITRRIPAKHLELLVLGVIVADHHESSGRGGVSSVEELYEKNEMGGQTFIHEYCTRQRFLKIIKGLAADELIVIRQIRGKEYPFIAGRG
jgi:hypothetical protein